MARELAEDSIYWHFDCMAEALETVERSPTILHTEPEWQMDDDQFFRFCSLNKDLKIERSAKGDIVIMAPEGSGTGSGSAELTYFFVEWARRDGTGRIFSSSAGFILPNRAMRSPDVAWVQNSRLAQVPSALRKKFLPLCPDFVLELRSPTDRLTDLKEKMQEYIKNGARLGWLLDPVRKQAIVYRPRTTPKIISNPQRMSGDPVLPGFSLDVPQIWAAIDLTPYR
jgi:Uma2 family endonuclease